MSIEELRDLEYNSFMEDFHKLIDNHRETLITLRMGISIEGRADCVHHKKNSYTIEFSGSTGITPVLEWHE